MTQKQYCYTAAAELLYEHFAYISAYTRCTLLFSLLAVCTDVHTLVAANTEEQGGCNYTMLRKQLSAHAQHIPVIASNGYQPFLFTAPTAVDESAVSDVATVTTVLPKGSTLNSTGCPKQFDTTVVISRCSDAPTAYTSDSTLTTSVPSAQGGQMPCTAQPKVQ
eukprot:16725-Heterococcus_DN1.PRE.1